MAEEAVAYVSIVPVSKGAGAQISKQIDGQNVGASVGAQLGSGITAGIGKTMRGAATATVATAAGLIGTSLTKGFARLTTIDQATQKLSGLGNSAKDVTEIMNDALASVKGTSFGMADAATIAASAVAAGIKPGQQLTKYLKLTADTATIAGTSLGDMGYILNQATTSGVVYTDTLNQLADRGIPIFQYLAQEYGISQTALRKMVQSGQVDAQHLDDALTQHISGAALKSGDTFTGAMANIGASLGRIGANLEKGFFPKLAPLAQTITGALGPLEDKATGLGTAIGNVINPAIDKLTGLLTNGISGFTGLGQVIAPLAGAFAALGAGGLAGLAKEIPIIGAFAGPLEALSGPIFVVAGAIAGLIAVSPGLQTALGGAFSSIATVLGATLGLLAPAFSEIGASISTLGGQLGSTLANVITTAVPVVLDLVQAFGNIVPVLVPILSTLAQLGGVLITSLGAALTQVMPAISAVVTALAAGLDRALIAITPALSTLAVALGQGVSAALKVLAPLFSQLVVALLPLVPVLTGMVSFIIPVLANLFNSLIPLVVQLVTAFAPMAAILVSALVPAVTQLALAFLPLIAVAAQLVAQIVPVLLPVFTQLVAAIVPLVALIITQLEPVFAQLVTAIAPLVTELAAVLIPIIQALLPVVTAVFGALVPIIKAALQIVTGVIQVVTGIISGNWSQVWTGIKNIFAGVWNGIVAVVRGAITIVGSVVKAGLSVLGTVVTAGVNAASRSFSSLGGKILSAVGDAAGILAGIGKNIVAGLVNGISGAWGRVTSVVQGLVDKIPAVVRKALGIHSPSTVFAALGRYVVQGFAQGITGSQKQVASAMQTLANKTIDAYNSTGVGRTLLKAATKTTAAVYSKVTSTTRAISASQRDAILKVEAQTNGKLQSLAAQRTSVAKRLTVANKALTAAQKVKSDYQASVLSGLAKFDTTAYSSPTSLINALTKRVADTKTFTSVMAQLRKAGLDSTTYQQFIAAGVSALPQAKALLAGGSGQIKQVASLQGQLSKASGSFASSAANDLYGAGVQAAQGLVNGLKSQQAAITKQMNAIAAAMVRTIKGQLGIHSPSRVMDRLIGRNVGAGLVNGIVASTAGVERAMGNLVAIPSAAKYAAKVAVATNGYDTARVPSVSRSLDAITPGQAAPVQQTNQFTIPQQLDPVGTSMAVANRLKMLNI